MTLYCANPNCEKALPPDILQRRHRSIHRVKSLCCNRACEIERRKAEGLYTAMSHAGTAARSTAVTKSNREHPRRKRQGGPIFA